MSTTGMPVPSSFSDDDARSTDHPEGGGELHQQAEAREDDPGTPSSSGQPLHPRLQKCAPFIPSWGHWEKVRRICVRFTFYPQGRWGKLTPSSAWFELLPTFNSSWVFFWGGKG